MVKQRIIEEASELFGRAGVKSITMDELSRHIGISKRTIYENFKNKEALLIACIEAFHAKHSDFSQNVLLKAENVAEGIVLMMRKDTEEASQRLFNIIDEIRKYYPRAYKECLPRFQYDKYSGFEQMLKRGINEGVFRENLNPEIIVNFFCRRSEDFAQNDSFYKKFSLAEVFENLVITFLRGICTAKGLEIIEKYKEKM